MTQTERRPAPAWRLRPATVDDVHAIVRVRAAAWADAYGHLVPAAHIAGLRGEAVERRWVGHVAAAAAADRVWVACADGDVEGFAIGGASRETPAAGEVFALSASAALTRRPSVGRCLRALRAAPGRRYPWVGQTPACSAAALGAR